MFVVIASTRDRAAQELVSQWQDAVLLTCKDLSLQGWQYMLNRPFDAKAIVSGNQVAVQDIEGVLTRIPYVYEHELVDIVPQDRLYVATEMTAFLFAWLSHLECPVLNKPTTMCLSGPSWRPERWIATAAQLGIPVKSLHRTSAQAMIQKQPDTQATTVTIVGSHCFGKADRYLIVQAQRLAEAADVDLLSVHFTSPEADACCLGADCWPDLNTQGIVEAIEESLRARQHSTVYGGI